MHPDCIVPLAELCVQVGLQAVLHYWMGPQAVVCNQVGPQAVPCSWAGLLLVLHFWANSLSGFYDQEGTSLYSAFGLG